MSEKIKSIVIAILVVLIVISGFLWYKEWKTKQQEAASISTSEKAGSSDDMLDMGDEGDLLSDADLDQEERDFNIRCEKGEWVEIADVSENLTAMSGKIRRVYPDDEASQPFENFRFWLDGPEKVALTGASLSSFDFFEDRDAEVQGIVKNGSPKQLEVARARCAGVETDTSVIESRNKILNWVAGNISIIAPKKAPREKWVVDIIDFVDGKNAYIEYYDTVMDDEDFDIEEDFSRELLVEFSPKPDGSYDANVLAYWEMGEDDYVLKSGTDKFEDAEDTISYQYDPEENSWTRI